MSKNGTPSALTNDQIKGPVAPVMDDNQPKGGPPELADFYQNLLDAQKKLTPPETTKNRKIFILRHGERIDFAFGSWVPLCFDNTGKYTRKDLNMPKTLPCRKQPAQSYLKDSPLTNVGYFQALTVGEAFKDKNVEISWVYCSPSYRCVQTADAFLRGLNLRDKVKIRIEPGLFEWFTWYPPQSIPEWMSIQELISAGFNVDENYTPFVSFTDILKNCTEENCEQFYARNGCVARGALAAHPDGNILLVGHSVTFETCSCDLATKTRKTPSEMMQFLHKIPYCATIQLECDGEKWKILESPVFPLTHAKNIRFDWTLIAN